MKIKLFGAQGCHKTQHYQLFLDTNNMDYLFLDVEKNIEYEMELRNLYVNKKLNFPTIVLNSKKLRNPSDDELIKWIDKLK